MARSTVTTPSETIVFPSPTPKGTGSPFALNKADGLVVTMITISKRYMTKPYNSLCTTICLYIYKEYNSMILIFIICVMAVSAVLLATYIGRETFAMQLDHAYTTRRRDPVVSASRAQEVFVIRTRLPLQQITLSQLETVGYKDEDALLMFRVIMKSCGIDPYKYKAVSSSLESDCYCEYVDIDTLQTAQNILNYANIVDRKILTYYVPFARFRSVKIFSGYISLLIFDKVYLGDKPIADYTPEPEFADETVNNVYRMFGIIEKFSNESSKIELLIENPIDIFVRSNDTLLVRQDQIDIELKPDDMVRLERQKVPDYNGTYKVSSTRGDFYTLVIDSTTPKKMANSNNGNGNGMCLSDKRIKTEYLCPSGAWDAQCIQNSDCPFYSLQTGQGGCDNGYCKMPLGVKRYGYKKYNGKPFCSACANPLKPECCEDLERYVF